MNAKKQTSSLKKIITYDTSLRDGTQAEEINFTVDDKLAVAAKLDELGIDYIEGGWPGSNPRDTEFFLRAQKELKLKKAKLSAFGSTMRFGQSPNEDYVLNQLLLAQTKTVCIFGKTWDLHVTKALGITLKQNLQIIQKSVAYLAKNKREVFFDAEHFFDGYKANPRFAFDCLKAAAAGGAKALVLCDTNGGTTPEEVAQITQKVVQKFKADVAVGIHCHNDCGLAVANSLSAIQNGATHLQGTINGIGERCGNANLTTLIANLELKYGYKTIGPVRLKKLTAVSRYLDLRANRLSQINQPYVGPAAFAHKGGVHVQAVLKDSQTYEHIQPQKVGNEQRVLLSDLSGKATLIKKAAEFGIDLNKQAPQAIQTLLADLKKQENDGFQFEGAEASFELLLRKKLKRYRPSFELIDFQVTDQIRSLNQDDEKISAKAQIHLKVKNKENKVAATGVGPVHALDKALRKALEKFYPTLQSVKLSDYKVRVLSGGKSTAAKVRVIIEFEDQNQKWATVGLSQNIVLASLLALTDGIEYKLTREKLLD